MRRALLIGFALSTFALAGCGGSSKPSGAQAIVVNPTAYPTYPPALGGSRPTPTDTPGPVPRI